MGSTALPTIHALQDEFFYNAVLTDLESKMAAGMQRSTLAQLITSLSLASEVQGRHTKTSRKDNASWIQPHGEQPTETLVRISQYVLCLAVKTCGIFF